MPVILSRNENDNTTAVIQESEDVTSVSDSNEKHNDEKREKSDVKVFRRKFKTRKIEPEWVQNFTTEFKQRHGKRMAITKAHLLVMERFVSLMEKRD